MQELLTFASQCGYIPGDIIPDGKIHRFQTDRTDHKKSGYYIFFQNFAASTGQKFYCGIMGSWASGERFNYQSPVKFSKEDRSLAKKNMELAQARADEEKRIKHDETSRECEREWAALAESVGDNPYLLSKGLKGCFGARQTRDRALVVPIRDVDGKIWSLQTIQVDGSKRYKTGGRISGCFHVIGSIKEDTVYLAEGFATAASIFEAIGGCTVASLDAGNLPKVARELKGRYPDKTYIVCGDEDQFKEKNKGREVAEEAAKIAFGITVFPKFKSLEEKPSDFNDLHRLEGIEAVKGQLKGKSTEVEKTYILPLGYRDDTYYYTSNCNKNIIALSAHGADNLLDLQPLRYWEMSYLNGKNGVDWKQAQSDLKEKCRLKGIFNPKNIRTLGVWKDEGHTVVHLGNRLSVDGAEMGLHEFKSKNLYVLDETQPPISEESLSIEECQVLVKAISNMAWSRPQDHIFFLGWFMSSLIGGTLTWRPHLWCVGASGGGKSTLYTLLAALNHYPIHMFGGGTTEAGLRRSVKSSAITVICDEFELNNSSTMNVNQNILAFMRQASSDTGAAVVKADGQKGTVSYLPKFCSFVCGIRPSFANEADRNRFTVVELDKAKQNAEQWDLVKGYVSKIDREYSKKLFSRAVKHIDLYRRNLKAIEQLMADKFYGRFVQQFAPIFAGYHLLVSDKEIDITDMEIFIEGMGLQNEVEGIKEFNDEEDALGHLLRSKIRLMTLGERSVAELVKMVEDKKDAAFALDGLMRHGLKYIKGRLFVINKHPELIKIFEKTKFQINWEFSLRRIPGATHNKSAKIFGEGVKGTFIPIVLEPDTEE